MSHKQAAQGFELAYCGTDKPAFLHGMPVVAPDRLTTVRDVIERSVGRLLSCYAVGCSV